MENIYSAKDYFENICSKLKKVKGIGELLTFLDDNYININVNLFNNELKEELILKILEKGYSLNIDERSLNNVLVKICIQLYYIENHSKTNEEIFDYNLATKEIFNLCIKNHFYQTGACLYSFYIHFNDYLKNLSKEDKKILIEEFFDAIKNDYVEDMESFIMEGEDCIESYSQIVQNVMYNVVHFDFLSYNEKNNFILEYINKSIELMDHKILALNLYKTVFDIDFKLRDDILMKVIEACYDNEILIRVINIDEFKRYADLMSQQNGPYFQQKLVDSFKNIIDNFDANKFSDKRQNNPDSKEFIQNILLVNIEPIDFIINIYLSKYISVDNKNMLINKIIEKGIKYDKYLLQEARRAINLAFLTELENKRRPKNKEKTRTGVVLKIKNVVEVDSKEEETSYSNNFNSISFALDEQGQRYF